MLELLLGLGPLAWPWKAISLAATWAPLAVTPQLPTSGFLGDCLGFLPFPRDTLGALAACQVL